MKKILVVEDNRLDQELIRDCLGESYALHFVAEAAAVAEALRDYSPDLVLLDIILPDGNGYEVFESLRGAGLGVEIPVVFLSGCREPSDKVRAFSLGADDYMVKPFEPLELRARVEARLAKRHSAVLERGPLRLDPTRMRVDFLEGGTLKLTPNEFRILFRLAEASGRALSREALLDTLSGDAAVTPRTIDAHVYSIRNKLGSSRGCIETVSRVGYRFNEKIPD